jgi:2-amino-4-hydroxy-6-hydroxymethyldihydropteridine diphosphokinase
MLETAYIGLGSNLAEPLAQLRQARQALAQTAGLRERACSSFYRSAPMGPVDQPDYVNAVMAVATELPPHELLNTLQALESSQGRVRLGERWGPRTLDLDILLYGEMMIADPILTVPHPGLAQREFVLYPLQEIAPPDLCIPGLGLLSELTRHCPRRGLAVIAHAG